MKKSLAWVIAATLLPAPALAQEDPLVDMLNNRDFDREEILQQFEHFNVTISPPQQQQDDAPAADTASPSSSPDAQPTFRPLTPELPPDVAARQPISALALILPLNGSGTVATAAEVFRQGCVDVLQAVNAPVQVDIYAHDGGTAQAITAYQDAVEDGARFVIGPMQKNNVRALRQAYPEAPVSTLLLQPAEQADNGESLYYVLTLDIGEEAAELARLIGEQNQRVMIIANRSAISQRQKSAFAKAWTANNNTPLQYFHVYDPSRDWQKLFDQLKDEGESKQEAPAATPSEPPLALFAAGNGDFIRRARNFVPQGYVLYASSVFFSSADEAKFLDNLRIMEMPWFITADSPHIRSFAQPQIRIRPLLQQRFYALGADACRAAQQSLLWVEGWRMQGASGTLELTAGMFRRRGILSQYQAGHLQPVAQ